MGLNIRDFLSEIEEKIEGILKKLEFTSIKKENLEILKKSPKQREALEDYPWDSEMPRNTSERLRDLTKMHSTYILSLNEIGSTITEKKFFPNYLFFNSIIPLLKKLSLDLDNYKNSTSCESLSDLIKNEIKSFSETLNVDLIKLSNNISFGGNLRKLDGKIDMGDLDIDNIQCDIPNKRSQNSSLNIDFICPDVTNCSYSDSPLQVLCGRQQVWRSIFKLILKKFSEPYKLIYVIENEIKSKYISRRRCGISIPYRREKKEKKYD